MDSRACHLLVGGLDFSWPSRAPLLRMIVEADRLDPHLISVNFTSLGFVQGDNGFKIVENGPPTAFTRAAVVPLDPFASPLFLRGSMNEWGISAPLMKARDGSYFVDMSLAAETTSSNSAPPTGEPLTLE